jgi:hypothetical protein
MVWSGVFKLQHEINYESAGIFVCLRNEDLGNAMGEGVQFEALGSMGPPTPYYVLKPQQHYGQEVN